MFTEEVPKDFKASCPCKRRGCPLQRFFEDRAHNKRFFTYQCSDPKVWASCNKTVKPDEVDPTKPKPTEQPKPTEDKPFKCPQAGCIFSTDNLFSLNKHLDNLHHVQPSAPAESAS